MSTLLKNHVRDIFPSSLLDEQKEKSLTASFKTNLPYYTRFSLSRKF